MKARWILAVAVSLPAAPAMAQADDPLTVAFAAACLPETQTLPESGALRGFDAQAARFVEVGWTPTEAGTDPDFAAYVATDLQAPLPSGLTTRLALFSAEIETQTIYGFVLALNGAAPQPLIACAVIDFEETAPAIAPLDAILGSPTETVEAITDAGFVRRWGPGTYNPGMLAVSLTYAPAGSLTAQNAHFAGASINARWFGAN